MILGNKVVKKLKLERNGLLNRYFFEKISFEHVDSWAKILQFRIPFIVKNFFF